MVQVLTAIIAGLIAHVACHPFDVQPNYKEVLRLSLLFYEAQRSGRLPVDNRIAWRGDSALEDRGLNGEDLTGGYYDAGDFVKFSFPMAFTTTLLAWGVLDYENAYKSADQYHHAIIALKWATDYFLKCHVSPYELYGQVGDFSIDHKFWGRPEELNMTRPAYKIDTKHPGADLAGEVSAALSSTALVFKNIQKDYYSLAIRHAQELYAFAVNYPGFYHEAIPGAKAFYQSTGFGDELTWAAIWLYKATLDQKYLQDAELFYKNFKLKGRPNEFHHTNKVAGIQVLLAELTGKSEYVRAVEAFCNYSIYQQKRTPKGLVYIDKAGTLSHAANIVFLCLQAVDMNISSSSYIHFAREQMSYILTTTGRSFVVGYGENYPKKPHHSASSCPDKPNPCGWESYKSKDPNPKILYGALVSGPDQNDHYEDVREEFLYNEVTLDYNAGFQSAAAGLLQYENK
ncbi:hypothetical protein PPYR_03427 [Photinus pyralis]|uniref:Endoglucanase n=1 Tax=Photinus pyralis TaxID=7054 RepID=A0A1Y1MBW0_PHOPY|nr:hypothetical protein PPYR_03427 [Photinus pyralis]